VRTIAQNQRVVLGAEPLRRWEVLAEPKKIERLSG
jgi:hypothetical protein